MTELARREQFLFGGKDLHFFWLEDINCMSKFVKEEELVMNDAMVLFTREKDSSTGQMV